MSAREPERPRGNQPPQREAARPRRPPATPPNGYISVHPRRILLGEPPGGVCRCKARSCGRRQRRAYAHDTRRTSALERRGPAATQMASRKVRIELLSKAPDLPSKGGRRARVHRWSVHPDIGSTQWERPQRECHPENRARWEGVSRRWI